MKRTLPLLAPAVALALLAGCARSEDASLVPPDGKEGYNQVSSVGTPEEDDREPAIGQWRASLQENVQALEFGPMGTEPLFSLLCTGNRSVLLQRHGGAPAGPIQVMQLSKGEQVQRLQPTAGGGTIPMLRVEVPLGSPLAEMVASGGEPLMVRLGDGAPMVLPASPLIGDYLRSCATAGALPASQGGTAGPQQPGAGANASAPAANSTAPAANGVAANAAQPK
jgi:hypothetical protein